MATHEASSLYSEEKAKLLRDSVAKIEDKNQILEKFMESLSSDSVYKIDMFKSLPDALLEKCAFLSVRPDTVKNLVRAMQARNRRSSRSRRRSPRRKTSFPFHDRIWN
ncbi:tyrosine-protein phosphatase non-receptor type 23-like [Sinocyclocheilus rhinocerous]|uniref:tyrosine-protein phosphatase non-receptor type 23-like n=1 Tax=Sinocyclocheilus rhinocerous TaxID=307959 RepID=UPI0007B981AC|nr:PREDICTED: tyrosine-protein phosphatase non-receptor type 23-like [Sinocyclocheilus rhinocerous]